MDAIFSASIIASFLGGMIALFAPCCITVLLPAYLASAFREKKNILRMTLIFFSGIAVVLIPIGLGAAWLANVFQNFHEEMYIAGGAFMILLAVLAFFGKGFGLPFAKKLKPRVSAAHPGSVFFLGILSGAATSCCAPVLAGMVTLAVVSGAFSKALIVTFAYVFGMVFPLFLAAYFYDRWKIDQSRFVKGKIFELDIAGKKLFVHSTNLIAAVIFLAIGGTMLILGFKGNAYYAPAMQAELGKGLTAFSNKAVEALSAVPDLVWGLVIAGIFGLFAFRALKGVREKSNEEHQHGNDGREHECHH